MDSKEYKITAQGLLFKSDKRDEPLEADEVARCTEHLRRFWTPSKAKTHGSYGLKHEVEKTLGGYCTNGSLIQAAVNLGIRIEPDGTGVNAKVFVKKNREAWKAFAAKYPHGRARFVGDDVNAA